MPQRATPISHPEVSAFFGSLPEQILKPMSRLRELIIDSGNGIESIGTVEETWKWGEPSYSTIAGSPLRIAWKPNLPSRYALCFHCQSKLVSTFRELYPNTFRFEGNRSIVFEEAEPIPETELIHCIELAHTYHRRKNKPMLGTNHDNE